MENAVTVKGRLWFCLGWLSLWLLYSVYFCLPAAAGAWITMEKIADDTQLQSNETVTWSGGYDENGYAAGSGILQWYVNGKPDNTYEGNLVKGQLQGQGTCTFANGNQYEGAWVDGQRTGRGVFIWTDGSRYEGDFAQDQRTGKGRMVYANGDRYEGDWAKGQRVGAGSLWYANGDRYEGEWRSNRRHGQGTLYLADGREQAGRWQDDGYLGEAPTAGSLPFILFIIGLAARLVAARVTYENRLAARLAMRYTAIYTGAVVLAAILLDIRTVEEAAFSWEIASLSLNNPLLVMALTMGTVVLWGKWRHQEEFSRFRFLVYSGLYMVFTAIFYIIWSSYFILVALYILRLLVLHG